TDQEQPATTFSTIMDVPQSLPDPATGKELTVATEDPKETLVPGESPTDSWSDKEEPPQSPKTGDQEIPASMPFTITSRTQDLTDPIPSQGTMATASDTANLVPGVESTLIDEPLSTEEPAATEDPDWTTGLLPTHTQWPSKGVLKPV